MKVIISDNNATTRVADEVYEAMQPYFATLYGNPSSMHTFGGQVGIKIREARERVAGLLGCDPSEIIFTSCGTESDSAAIHGALAVAPQRRKVITTRVEHPAVLSVCRDLETHGYTVVELGVDKLGRLDLMSWSTSSTTTRHWSRSCTPTMRPVWSSPSSRSPRW